MPLQQYFKIYNIQYDDKLLDFNIYDNYIGKNDIELTELLIPILQNYLNSTDKIHFLRYNNYLQFKEQMNSIKNNQSQHFIITYFSDSIFICIIDNIKCDDKIIHLHCEDFSFLKNNSIIF